MWLFTVRASATIRVVSSRQQQQQHQKSLQYTCLPLFTSRRWYVNALYRIPPQHTVPTHNPNGEEVDTELFVRQVKDLFNALKQTQLVEQIHEMRSCPYYDSLFTGDVLFQHYDVVLPMPKYGREHRSSEVSETLRYLRACGATGDFNHILQDVKGGAASGGDFVSTTHGILMAYGTPRTNKLAMMALTGGSAPNEAAAVQQRALNVVPIEVAPDAPPLGDIMAFAGKRTLIVQDTVHGRHAAEVAANSIQKVPWQIVRVEPGCSFLSHLCGVNAVYDVLVDQDYPMSMERVGEAGLNPFPVEWTEPRKLGISMRSVCLIARFARGTMSAGGYADSHGHRAATFNYHSRNIAKNTRLFQNGHRRHGDNGPPLEAQLRSGELPEAVYQSPPRYAPPMHRHGMHTTSTIAWSQNAQLMLVLLLSVLPTVPHLAEAGVEETMPLPPLTNPEITSTPEKEGDDDIDRMLPVKLNLILNDAFFAGESINPFAGASLQLTFNVPNPGYDVALGVNTNTQPLLKDQYGHVWVAEKEIAVSFVKKQTRRTYRIDDVRVVRKNSVSEEATVLKGSITDDPLCNSGKLACCPSGEGHYTQYSLVQSPVPPYHCTEAPVVFIDGSFSFQYEGRVTFGEESASTRCDVLTRAKSASKECNDGSVIVDVKRLPLTYVFPVSALSLCRPGENLTDTTYTSQPFFATFCETARCIGYTSENYKVDRGTCEEWPLGSYTSPDVNNTNQFSYYEKIFLFLYVLPDCVWMNDVLMGPGNTLKELTLRCNMPPSTDWSVSHRFPSTAPLVQFIRPTFLYGRATRTEASRTVTDGVAVAVEFVSFSPANGTWTMTACYEKGDVCKSAHFTVRGNNDWKPMQINVELPSAVNTNSEASVAVLVQVESLATPVRSPFRFLLEKRRLIIQPAKPSAAAHSGHVNLDLARQPYERIPPPQNTNGKMMQCVDDFTFSASTGGCVPFTDDECTRKYKGRRNKFDPKKKSCGVTLPLRTEKIRAVPIPLPQAPKEKKFDRAEQRKFLEELKLPKWMKPMKQLLQEYDEMQKSGKKTVPKKPQPPAEPQKASQTATMVVNVFFVLGTVGNIILICVRDRLLNFFVRCYRRFSSSSSSPSATRSRNWSFVFEIVPARISTYFSSSIPAQMQGRETTVPVDGAGPNAGSQTPPRRSFLTQQQQQVVAQYQQKQQQQAMMMQLQQQLLLQQQQQAQAQSPLYPYPNVGLVAPSPQQQQQQMHQYVIPGYPNEPYFHGEPTQR